MTTNTLTQELQQQCTAWGAYWRASDAHGVELTPDQALNLLRRALGVEVEIKPRSSGCTQIECLGRTGCASCAALAAADAQPVLEGEREAFEAWAPTHHKLTSPGPLTRLDGDGRYFYGPVQACWLAWQARAAQAAAPAPAPLTDEQIRLLPITADMGWEQIVRIVERAHGIGGKA